jgi:hypothetical protein
MFKLFSSIFDTSEHATDAYPDWLIDKAIERAVDGLDSRLRLVSSYKKKLRASVMTAVDHVVKLVDDLPAPIDASRSQFGADPHITSLFASANELQQFFSNDKEVWHYLDNLSGPKPDSITGLLIMDRIEKQVFGMELDGNSVRRDVAQVTVSFSEHRLADPNTNEQETRRHLKRRAFDHLVTLALRDVTTRHRSRLELEQQWALLQRKLGTYKAAGWGLTDDTTDLRHDNEALQQELNQVEAQLKALPAKTETLDASLDALIDVFDNAKDKLWSVPVSLFIDRMHIKRDAKSNNTNELRFTEFHSANGAVKIGIMVSYPINELLPRKKFLSNV